MLINVLFCTDANFWQPVGVAVASLLLSNPNHTFRIVIASAAPAHPRIFPEIQEFARQQGNAEVEFATCEAALQYQDLPTNAHLTLGAYLRLFMTEFLDPSVDKILYLDSDLLVCADIGELWQIDLGDFYLGAAPEPYNRSHREPLGFGPSDLYVNSGVMLVNVAKWRRDNVLPKFMRFAFTNAEKLPSVDQDILNSVFRGRILNIGYKWNWQALFPRFEPGRLGMSLSEYEDMKRHPRIVHYTSGYKPWFFRWAPHYQGLYRDILRRTPWAGTQPPDRSLRNVPLKLVKIAQRALEWHFPSVARKLISRRHAA